MNTQGIAVITGASSGIGKVYADRFAKRGYDLLLVARRKDRLDELSKELQQKHAVKVDTLVADLTKHEDLEKVGKAIASDERISVLVNNAGTAVVGPSAQIPIENVEFQLDLNARSVTYLSQAILPGFIKRDSGTLINIGSVLSFFAYPFSTSYSASKAHVLLYTIGLHDELANTGVRVQAVLPSNTYSEIWEVSGMGGRLPSTRPCLKLQRRSSCSPQKEILPIIFVVFLLYVQSASAYAGVSSLRRIA